MAMAPRSSRANGSCDDLERTTRARNLAFAFARARRVKHILMHSIRACLCAQRSRARVTGRPCGCNPRHSRWRECRTHRPRLATRRDATRRRGGSRRTIKMRISFLENKRWKSLANVIPIVRACVRARVTPPERRGTWCALWMSCERCASE